MKQGFVASTQVSLWHLADIKQRGIDVGFVCAMGSSRGMEDRSCAERL